MFEKMKNMEQSFPDYGIFTERYGPSFPNRSYIGMFL